MTTELTLKTKLESIVKVYPMALPEEPLLPAITYQRISTVPQRNHSSSNFDKDRFQVRVFGKYYLDVLDIADQIVNLLDLNIADFKFSSKENRFDVKETDTGLYSTVLEFFVWD